MLKKKAPTGEAQRKRGGEATWKTRSRHHSPLRLSAQEGRASHRKENTSSNGSVRTGPLPKDLIGPSILPQESKRSLQTKKGEASGKGKTGLAVDFEEKNKGARTFKRKEKRFTFPEPLRRL